MQAGCADRAAARPEEGRSHHAGKAARTKQAGSAGSAARAAAQREEGSSHHAGQAARTMQVGSAGSADRAAARRADPRSIHSPPPPPPHTFRTPRTHRKARLPVQGTAAFKMLVGVQVQAAQSRDLENLREWRVVEPDVAGSVHISRQVQVWRMAGRVGPRSSTESQVNADLTRTLDRFSLAKAEGLLTGTSHSAIESYQATMEDWVLENYDHLYQSRVEGQEENDVVKYLSFFGTRPGGSISPYIISGLTSM